MSNFKNFLRFVYIQFSYSLKPFAYLPVSLIKNVILGKDPYLKQYFWDKWGFLNKHLKAVLGNAKQILWIDVRSGGEILQLVTFLSKLKEHNHDLKIILSTGSDDVYRYAQQLKSIDFIFNTPWDFAFVARRVIRQIQPSLLMSVELSSIPVHFKVARRAGIVTVLLSGLMSYGWQQQPTMSRAFALEFYRYFDFIAAKEERDFEGFAALGISRTKIFLLGNMKFDIEYLKSIKENSENLRKDFQINPSDKIFLAASVLPPEEKVVIDAFVKAKKKIENLRLIMAPRYEKDTEEIIKYLKQRNLAFVRRTELKKSPLRNNEVIIVDTFGELAGIYHLANYIFMSGGSISPWNKTIGWKNMVEPLFSKKPILFGPFLYKWREIIEELKSIYNHCEVRNAEELASSIVELEQRPDLQEALQQKADEFLSQRTNIIEDNVKFIESLLYPKKAYK